MTTHDLHTVLGASGGAGTAITLALHESGHHVRSVSRSGSGMPDGVDVVQADITDPAALASAIADSSVVYMAAQPAYHRWSDEFPAMLGQVITACGSVDAKLVMVDNLYAYGPGHDRLTEKTPHAATDDKGLVRSRMYEQLMAAHRDGTVRVAIGQASDYFGPHSDNSAITSLAIAPAAGTGALRWIGSLDTPHSVAYLPDIARAYVVLGTNPAADGRAWILPHGEAVTGRHFLELVNDQLDEQRKTSVVSKLMLRLAAPFHKITKETLSVSYQWTEPWIADDSEFEQTFGPFVTTPLESAVKESVEAYR